MKRFSCDDTDEVRATDFLAKTVLVSRKIGPIGFIRFEKKTKPKPAAPKKLSRKLK